MNLTRQSVSQHIPAVVIILTMAIIFTVGNASLRPDLMEVRNLVTAREMVYDQHIMVPTMNGELRLEKPPLPTWIAAAVEYVLPDNISAQRTVAAVMAMLWAMWLYLFAKAVTRSKKFALFAMLLFATCYPTVLHARTATWDIFCHSFMMGAIYHIYRAMYGNLPVAKHFVLGGLLFGLSFMSKGPVAVYALFLPFLISALCCHRPVMSGKYLPMAAGIVIAVCVSASWYGYLVIFEPEAIRHVINKESGSWIDHNVRPWYYYWRFFAETGIWAILMLSSVLLWFKRKHVFQSARSRQWTFFILWTTTSLVLLSLMPEKKMRYLLPMMVPCSLCMVFALEFISKGTTLGRTLFAINKWVIAVIIVSLPVVAYIFIVKGGQMSLPIYAIFTLGCLVFTVLVLRIRQPKASFRLVTLVYALFAWVALFILPNLDCIFGNTDSRKISSLKDDTALKEMPMLYVRTGEHVFRIDMVYLTYHKIKEITPKELFNRDSTTFNPRLPIPCALLSDSATAITIRTIAHSKGIPFSDYGKFDDNISSNRKGHYKPGLCNNLTVLHR